MVWLSSVVVVLIVLLALYALGYYLTIFVFLWQRLRPGQPDSAGSAPQSNQRVAVLIPARNEGERVLSAARSLIDQDCTNAIDIYVLLNDEHDSSVPCLQLAGGTSPGILQPQPVDFAFDDTAVAGERQVCLVFTGVDAKSAKINALVPQLDAPYLAILDSDHRAGPEWLRTSLDILNAPESPAVVQGRRSPLDAGGLLRLWDSLHQHIGCEVLNTAFARLGLTVFFTGTTSVMRTQLLRDYPLYACITEDADFSYQLVLSGHRIAHNARFGSHEEVAPNLFSFLARRRRWANGHTATFFRHLPGFFRAALGPGQRVQFLYHGSHYLVALLVAVLHFLIGFYFLQGMAWPHIFAATVPMVLLAWRLSLSQRSRRWFVRLSEVVLVAAWFVPAAAIVLNGLLAMLAGDLSRAALPVPTAVHVLGLICFLAPLLLLLVGLAGYGQLSARNLLLVTLSYPVAFYLDIAGVLIGLGDLVTGYNPWHAVTRAPVTHGEPRQAVSRKTVFAKFRKSAMLQNWKLSALVMVGLIVLLVLATIVYTPRAELPVEFAENSTGCVAREHDDLPWILPPGKMNDYCKSTAAVDAGGTAYGGRRGTFQQLHRREDFTKRAALDAAYWDRLDTTFFCNLAVFRPENVSLDAEHGLALELRAQAFADRRFTSGSIATKADCAALFQYGRFEAEIKAARASGTVTAFFLYRFDPWQEIDTEFLGNDTTKLLLNVYYNPGMPGDTYNYGFRGTPVVIDLGFDAAADFHHYALEWDPEEIRWFVDGKLVHRRRAGRPTPIPHLPMRLHLNLWPTCSEELAGPFDAASPPVRAQFRSVQVHGFRDAAFPAYSRLIDSVFSFGGDDDDPRVWRQGDEARWMGLNR